MGGVAEHIVLGEATLFGVVTKTLARSAAWQNTLMLRLLTFALTVSCFAQVPHTAGPDATVPSVAMPNALERVLRDYEKAWTAKDASALASLFAADGFILSPGHRMVRGRAAIEAHYRAQSGGPLSLRAVAFATDRNAGYIIGGYAKQAGEPDIGKFTLTIRKSGSRWLIFSDMDNGNSR